MKTADQKHGKPFAPGTRIIRLREVATRTGLSRSMMYAKLKDGTFPPSVSLGSRAVGWIETEIDSWISGRIEHSRVSVSSNGGRDAK